MISPPTGQCTESPGVALQVRRVIESRWSQSASECQRL
jgi:hypothetical protein